MSSAYIMLVVVTLIIGLGATWLVNHQLKKYRNVPSSLNRSGAQMAQYMLSANRVSGVSLRQGGYEQDHFDPRDNSITLDPEAFHGSSITALATACHEAGHACQFAEGYMPMKIRGALVPAVNFASNAWIFILLGGILLSSAGLIQLAVVVYAIVVLFQLVTLPVEFNASRRGLAYLSNTGMPQAELAGASKVLTACAMTYVAAALTSILQLLWLLGQNRD